MRKTIFPKEYAEYTEEAATGDIVQNYKKVVLKNFAKFSGKDLCQSLL